MGEVIAFPGCETPVSTVETGDAYNLDDDPGMSAEIVEVEHQLDNLIEASTRTEFCALLDQFKRTVEALTEPDE